MKPITKLQKQIHGLVFKFDEKHAAYIRTYKNLPKLSEAQKRYADKHCLDHTAFLSKSGTLNCMDCGHTWKTERPLPGCDWHHEITKGFIKCPSCNVALDIKVTQERTKFDGSSLNIITTCKGFQVIRYFEINGYSKTKQPKKISYIERGQIWIAPDGRYEAVGNLKNYYNSSWYGSFELRQRNNADIYKSVAWKTYPRVRTIPEIDRNGFYGNFFRSTPFDFFKAILASTYSETLLKEDQIALFEYTVNDERGLSKVQKYWRSIKIALRNNYMIRNASDYIDYLGLLEDFNKDTRSVKYICPRDLHTEHNRYVEKAREKRRRQEEKDRIIKDQIAQENYEKHILKFINLRFKTMHLSIRPLLNVTEVKEVGDKLRHCIYSNRYYENTETLLMCAYKEDLPIETIEISLKSFSIKQSRGLQNKETKFHNEILDVLNQNMINIKKAMKPKRKSKSLA